MPRQIKIDLEGEFSQKNTKVAGSAQSANVSELSIGFDRSWDGFARRVLFYDAREESVVTILLGDGVETGDERVRLDGGRYILPIPAEPLRYMGWMSLVIEAYAPDTPSKVLLSVRERLYVHESEHEKIKPAEPTASQILQLKSYVDAKVSEEYGAIATINQIPSPKGNIELEGGTGVRVTARGEEKKVLFEATGEAVPGYHGHTHNKYGSDPIVIKAQEVEYDDSDVKSVVQAHIEETIANGVHGIKEEEGRLWYQKQGQWVGIDEGFSGEYAKRVHTHDVSQISGVLPTDGSQITLGKLRIMSNLNADGVPYAIFSLDD